MRQRTYVATVSGVGSALQQLINDALQDIDAKRGTITFITQSPSSVKDSGETVVCIFYTGHT